MAVSVKRLGNIRPQYDDSTGVLASSYRLFFYAAGSSTKQNTYNSSAGTVANSNPIVLNALGEPAVEIWLQAGLTYKVGLAIAGTDDPPASFIWTEDNISGINDAGAVVVDEWSASALTPTFVSGTSFTLSGDQTTEFHKQRRLKSTNTSGSIYSSITGTSFAASVTTVTVANDSGVLDSGLSAVSLGISRATNPSISPDVIHRKGTAVASAATTDIWSIAGDYVHITGAVTITSLGTAPYAGDERAIIFDGALTLTYNATTLQLPGAANIFTAAGDRMTVKADTTANMIVTSYTRASGAPVVGASVLRNYLAGLNMSTAGSSATMTTAAGQATDSTNVVMMNLAASIAKTTSAWAVGSAAGGLDTGGIANSTWYHFWLITRPDTGVVDVLISLSASAPTMPTNYTLKRRIGSGLTNGSAQWVAFTQYNDDFYWSVPVLDISAANPGTSAVTRTLTSVPSGVKMKALLNVGLVIGATSTDVYLSSLDTVDAAASPTAAPLGQLSETTASGQAVGYTEIYTDTSQAIRSRISNSDASTTLRIATLGWQDRRGRDS